MLLYHLWPARVHAGFLGVDVFFVISGFLITSHLARECERHGTVRLATFWGRRMRRILPAAFLVLSVTLTATLTLTPLVIWRQVLRDIQAAAVYLENWRLALASVNYFDTSSAVSPVQHYWSLSVEEQFYIVWPLLIAGLLWLARRGRRRGEIARAVPGSPVRAIAWGAATVVVVSLTTAAWQARTNPTFEYFSTLSQAWKFALGGLLGCGFAPLRAWLLRAPDRVRTALPLLAYALILGPALLYDSTAPFRGTALTIPMAGAALAIASPPASRSSAIGRLVAWRPVQWVGDQSYAIYLWHWPLIVLFPYVTGRALTAPSKLGLLVAVFVLAGLTRRFVEDPVRYGALAQRSPARTIALTAACSVVLLLAAQAPLWRLDRTDNDAGAYAAEHLDDPCFGAHAAEGDRACPASHIVDPRFGPQYAKDDYLPTWISPQAAAMETDMAACDQVGQDDVTWCGGQGPIDAPITIALVGDSHAGMWQWSVANWAAERGYRLERYTRSDCRAMLPLNTMEATPLGTDGLDDCRTWQEDLDRLIRESPTIDLIVTSGMTRQYGERSEQTTISAMARNLRDTWEGWVAAGKPVVVIHDVTDRASQSAPDCIAASDQRADPCTLPRAVAAPPDPVDVAATGPAQAGVRYVDPTPALCDEEICHFVVGSLITHRDNSHLASTFTGTLNPLLFAALDAADPGAG